MMRFVAQAISLRNENYLVEHVLMDAARVFVGGKCNWVRVLEKAMANQMVKIRGKGQKLYTCTPI